MNSGVHICANKGWGGAETRAIVAAAGNGIIVTGGNAPVVERMRRSGATVFPCKMSGMMASVNLSRVLRHLPADYCRITVHSPQLLPTVRSAIRLSGRGDLEVVEPYSPPEFPAVQLPPAEPGEERLLVWVGRITPECGLRALIDALGRLADSPDWRLRVIGEGDAKVAMPLVNRTRALGIDKRVEWTGYSDDVYSLMNQSCLGVITREDPENRTVWREFVAASLPTVTGTNAETLLEKLKL